MAGKNKFNAQALMKASEGANLTDTRISPNGGTINGESFEYLDVDSIENNPLQPRKTVPQKELEELSANIELHGLIQPITVIRVSDKKLILLAGQRRLMAHKHLQKDKIKAIVREDKRFNDLEELNWLNDENITKVLFEISVSENDSRESLTPLETALAIDEVLKKGAYESISQVAEVLGKSKAYIGKIYSTLNLSQAILDDLVKTRGVGHVEALYELQKIKDEALQTDLYNKLKAGEINIDNIKVYSVKKSKVNKTPYQYKVSKNNLSLKIDTKGLSKEDKESMDSELKNILKKYLDR